MTPCANRPIVLSRHAEIRASERGFQWGDVEGAIRNPDTTYTGTDGKLNYLATASNGRRIRVVVAVEEEGCHVVTVIAQGEGP